MKKCFLIGGGGFIGLKLAAQLSSRREVIIVDHHFHQSNHLPKSIKYINKDYANDSVLTQIAKQGNEVINLAYSSVPKTSFEDPISDIINNLPSVVKLFQSLANSQVSRIIHFSSGGTIYGPSKRSSITEDELKNPISPYGITKLAIEHYAFMFHRHHKLPIICVRPANAYGEGQLAFRGQGFIATAIASILQKKPVTIYGKDGTTRDYVYIDDLVTAIKSLLFKGQLGKAYNIGTNTGTTNKQIINLLKPLAKQNNLPLKVITQPSRAFDVPVNILNYYNLHQDTGWKPRTSLKEGLKKTWNWYLKNYHNEDS